MLKKLFAVTTLATMSGAAFAADAPALPFGLSFSGSAKPSLQTIVSVV